MCILRNTVQHTEQLEVRSIFGIFCLSRRKIRSYGNCWRIFDCSKSMRMCENMERTKSHPQRLLRCWRGQKPTNPKSKFLVVPPVPPSWLRLRAGWVLTAFFRPGPLCTAGRFVCGLTLKTAHWGSSIKMHSYVIGGHRFKLYGYSAFERFLVYCVPVSIDIPFPMGLWIQSANSTADRVPLTAQV
jgi:hypothetical protein